MIVTFIILQILFNILIVLAIRVSNTEISKAFKQHKDAINYLLEGAVNHKESLEKIVDYLYLRSKRQ